jgi:hypothetical protein
MEQVDQAPGYVSEEQLAIERSGLAARAGAAVMAGMEAAQDTIGAARRNGRYYLALAGAVATAVAGNTARTMIFNPESAAAEDVPTPPTPDFGPASLAPATPWAVETPQPIIDPATGAEISVQSCIDAALAMPQVLHTPTMYDAGLRPGDPHHYNTQGVTGAFWYPLVPYGCPVNRTSRGQIQLGSRDNPKKWINNSSDINPEYLGNQKGEARIRYGPSHAWPEYLFAMCVPGKGFQEARMVITNAANDVTTGERIEQKKYVLRIPVHGNCRSAERSKEATKNLRAEWGQ